MEHVLYSAKLKFSDYLKSFLIVAFATLMMAGSFLKITEEHWIGPSFIALFFLLVIVQVLRGEKTFVVTRSVLIIHRPLFPYKAADVSFPINQIKEVIFKHVSGRFGGPHIIIKAKSTNETYHIDLSDQELNAFIDALASLNVKVDKGNIF